MSDQHSEGMPDSTVTVWKTIFYAVIFIWTAFIFFSFRRIIVGTILNFAAYIVWRVNILGRVIPQPVLWAMLLVLLLYIASGSFYRRRPGMTTVQGKLEPPVGPVEARARWIESHSRGTYFKWQLANLLGRLSQNIRETNQHEKSKNDLIPARVREYLDAGLNTSFTDYSLPKLFQKKERTALDIDLEEVLAYLEGQLEIKDDP